MAVQDTTTQQTDELPAKNQACVSAAGKPPIEILPFYGQDQATNAVIAGDVDAMSADSPGHWPQTDCAVRSAASQLSARIGATLRSYAVDVTLGGDERDRALPQHLSAALVSASRDRWH